MKDFEDMTSEEKQKILEQIQNLQDEPQDAIDLFTQSFNELSKNWTGAIKEFETIYSDSEKDPLLKLDNQKH